MSIRFMIKNTQPKAEREGDLIVRYTGTSEPFYRVSDRDVSKVGTDSKGNAKLIFTTGLDEKKAKFYSWYNEKEKEEVIKQIQELKPLISDFYGGEDVIQDTNEYFWKDNRDVSRISLTNDDVDMFFDTKQPVHALLYLSIISGAFIDLVAPTKEYAEDRQIFHYLALETDAASEEDDEDITRMTALAALADLSKNADPEALFILAWCTQYETQAYGAQSRATSFRDLMNYHIKFIEGKLVQKKKRNTPKVFLDYVRKWNGKQTRPALYAEAYIKAGDYYNYVQQRDKKYSTQEGTTLGNTIPEAVENIMKPKFSQDLEALRDKVEAKWKE